MTTQPPDKSSNELLIDTSPEFKKALRTLKKRYRSIGRDIKPIINQILAGQLPGEQIAGSGFVVYKVRIKNSNIDKGKSAGYRLIYWLESEAHVALLAIYSKSDKTNISIQAIRGTISEMSSSSD